MISKNHFSSFRLFWESSQYAPTLAYPKRSPASFPRLGATIVIARLKPLWKPRQKNATGIDHERVDAIRVTDRLATLNDHCSAQLR